MHFISSFDDPRIAGYRSLRERDLRAEGLFITEGALLAERLLQSRFPVQSLFVTAENAAQGENAARFAELLNERAPLYVAEAALMRQIAGFDFHRGVLGLGRRLPFPDADSVVIPLAASQARLRFIACPDTQTTENLGLILRSATAFGVEAVLLPMQGADPLSRRCLRQSMGSALSARIARSTDLLQELCRLRQTIGLQLVTAVVGTTGEDNGIIALNDFSWPPRAVLIVGNEHAGLDAQWLQHCDYRVTIPLAPGCDSLNVAVATGVFLHHMSCASTTDEAAG